MTSSCVALPVDWRSGLALLIADVRTSSCRSLCPSETCYFTHVKQSRAATNTSTFPTPTLKTCFSSSPSSRTKFVSSSSGRMALIVSSLKGFWAIGSSAHPKGSANSNEFYPSWYQRYVCAFHPSAGTSSPLLVRAIKLWWSDPLYACVVSAISPRHPSSPSLGPHVPEKWPSPVSPPPPFLFSFPFRSEDLRYVSSCSRFRLLSSTL